MRLGQFLSEHSMLWSWIHHKSTATQGLDYFFHTKQWNGARVTKESSTILRAFGIRRKILRGCKRILCQVGRYCGNISQKNWWREASYQHTKSWREKSSHSIHIWLGWNENTSWKIGMVYRVRQFSNVVGIIKVDDFYQEFTMWCKLQCSPIGNFNPYMVWWTLLECFKETPLPRYGELKLTYSIEILAWRCLYGLQLCRCIGRGSMYCHAD